MKNNVKKKLEYFKKCCIEYIEKIGLKEFEYDICLDDSDRRGGFECNIEAGIASIFISEEWLKEENPNYKEIRRCAFHEVLECMLCELRDMGDKMFSYGYVDKRIHKIIRCLENYEFGV
jgi:hypothetical protein